MTCRDWLQENGYADVAALIDQAIAKIKAKGSKQRRNWWDILSGGANGESCVREGIVFPVLRVAQIRQGKPATPNAVCRDENEQAPEVLVTNRWRKKKLPSKTKGPAQKVNRARARRAQAS